MLVVDDDAAIRETLHQLLEDEGYDVAQAPDGVIALDILRSTPRRMVVLLDVMMPRLDGYGVLLAVVADERLTHGRRYIIMSAAVSSIASELTQLMRRIGAPALTKPFSIDLLLSAIADAASQIAD